jgi:hypothetical protein
LENPTQPLNVRCVLQLDTSTMRWAIKLVPLTPSTTAAEFGLTFNPQHVSEGSPRRYWRHVTQHGCDADPDQDLGKVGVTRFRSEDLATN